MKKEKTQDEIDLRVKSFIIAKGGASKLAKEIGLKPQNLQAILDGGSVGGLVFKALAKAIGYDYNFIFNGIRSENLSFIPMIDFEKENYVLKQDVEKYKTLYEEINEKNEILEERNKALEQTTFKIIRNIPDKALESFSRVTDEAEGKMIALDVEWHDRKIIGFEINKNRA